MRARTPSCRALPWLLLAVVCLLSPLARAQAPAAPHLRAGASAFRAGRFEEALVEFKVARTLGADGRVLWYLAATLTRLERAEEALEAFAEARRAAPELGDALLDYYLALACQRAQLLTCAEAALARVDEAAGPRVAAQARALRSAISATLEAGVPDSALEACRVRARDARARGRAAVARLYEAEAEALQQLATQAAAAQAAVSPEAPAPLEAPAPDAAPLPGVPPQAMTTPAQVAAPSQGGAPKQEAATAPAGVPAPAEAPAQVEKPRPAPAQTSAPVPQAVPTPVATPAKEEATAPNAEGPLP